MTYHVTWCSLQIFSSYRVCILIPAITDSSSLSWLSRDGYSCWWYRGWSRRGTNWPHNRAIKKRVDILMLKCFVSSHNLKTSLALIQFSFKIHLPLSSSSCIALSTLVWFLWARNSIVHNGNTHGIKFSDLVQNGRIPGNKTSQDQFFEFSSIIYE